MRSLFVTLSIVLLAGCSGGPEAHRADALLRVARAEQVKLQSAAYGLQMTIDFEGQKLGVELDGAVQLAGAARGDHFLSARANMPADLGQAGFEMQMAKRGRRVTMWMNGREQRFDTTSANVPDLDAWASFGSLDLASCVKNVDVRVGRNLNGEPATRIAGVLDSSCVLEAASAFAGASQLAQDPFGTAELAKHVDDVRATLFVSERTRLLIGAVLTTSIEAEGRSADVRLVYRLKSVNKPLRFPAGA
jgi:hypothetical protein